LTENGRPLRLLKVLDEFSRLSLAIRVERRLTSADVVEVLEELFVMKGVPEYIRSDNASEFTAQVVRDWLASVGVQTLFIEPGSPWEKGYASHCTSCARFGTRSKKRRRFESLQPCFLTGSLSPGCSYRHSFLSL
jgi:putative transposase